MKNRLTTTLCAAIVALALGLQPFISFAATTPQRVTGIVSGAGIVVSEVYPNSAQSPESGDGVSYEFIELHNQSDLPVPLSRLMLVRDDTPDDPADTANEQVMGFGSEDEVLQPGERLAFNTTFSLVNGGTTLQLYYVDEAGNKLLLLQRINYPAGLAEVSSLQLYENQWYIASPPTPNEAMPIPPEAPPAEKEEEANEDPATDEPPATPKPDENPDTGQAPAPEPQTCAVTDVRISEILPNPSGSDSDGGEFIELYNSASKTAVLLGCTLSTDKLEAYEFSENDRIAPKGYTSIAMTNDLLNSGGKVTFSANTYEEAVHYPELNDDEAYALIDGSWHTTKKPTPGDANRLPSALDRANALRERLGVCPAGQFRNLETHRCNSASADESGLQPCAPNQFRNPATNRCKLKASAADELKPCDPGEFRNPATNRCKSAASDSGLKPCDAGQYRNPATNRCKLKDSDDGLKPCDEDQYRHSETNRCRNKEQLSSGVLSATDSDDENSSGTSGHSLALVLIAGLLLAFFLLYEYRLSIRDWFDKLRPKPSRSA